MKKISLDKDEMALEKEIEKGEWLEVDGMAEEIKKYQTQAGNALNKIDTPLPEGRRFSDYAHPDGSR